MAGGSLTLVATPIGHLGDLSPRAEEALRQADFWLVEDTRVSGKLRSKLELRVPLRVLNDHTSEEQIQRYLDEVQKGARAAVLSDAGSPVVSDPGALLVDLAYRRGLAVDAVPGPSAVTAALMLGGFFAQRFAFLGFLPRRDGPARKELAFFAESPYTLVLFESPHRMRRTLALAHEVLGERRYAICRELSKVHQQVYRGVLPSLPSEEEVPSRGEVTLLVEGRRSASRVSSEAVEASGILDPSARRFDK